MTDGTVSPVPPLLVFAICTRDRPVLLAECLRSILKARATDRLRLAVIVVENAAREGCANIVAGIAADAPFPLRHVLHTDLGIPQARNRSVEEALAIGADWIAFIDDDETLAEDWLIEAAHLIEGEEGDVHVGPVFARHDGPRPVWLGREKVHFGADGEMIDWAATNNAIAKRRVFTEAAMWFDPALRFTGSEDKEFFSRVARSGATIRWSDAIRVYEWWPAVRLRPAWHLRRRYWTILHYARSEVASGKRGVRIRMLRTGLGFLISALPLLVAGVIAFPFARGRRVLFRGAVKLAEAAGHVGGLLGLTFEPYRRIEPER
ncbi:MAG: glycosyltransferase family 2 protein [Rubricella sp.]